MSGASDGTSGRDGDGVEAPPPAAGVRMAWPSVPAGLRYAVEQQLGGRVVEAVTQPGGFSPGVAARLKTATGTRARPWACLAAPWFDLVAMLPSVHMQGSPSPETLFNDHPVTRTADPGAVTAVLAALTGFFVRQSRQPPPPGLPTLRAFQAAQGRTALDWLKGRTTWR
jgi:hypothetical protein